MFGPRDAAGRPAAWLLDSVEAAEEDDSVVAGVVCPNPRNVPMYPAALPTAEVAISYAALAALTGRLDPAPEYASVYVWMGTMTRLAVAPRFRNAWSVCSSSAMVRVRFGRGVSICFRL